MPNELDINQLLAISSQQRGIKKRYSITLTDETHKEAKRLGGGNLSHGVRTAIIACMQILDSKNVY